MDISKEKNVPDKEPFTELEERVNRILRNKYGSDFVLHREIFRTKSMTEDLNDRIEVDHIVFKGKFIRIIETKPSNGVWNCFPINEDELNKGASILVVEKEGNNYEFFWLKNEINGLLICHKVLDTTNKQLPHRAQRQLLRGLQAVIEDKNFLNKKISNRVNIFPILVTNAKLYVNGKEIGMVLYQFSDKFVDPNGNMIGSRWWIASNVFACQDPEKQAFSKLESDYKVNVFVVNVEHLESFLTRTDEDDFFTQYLPHTVLTP